MITTGRPLSPDELVVNVLEAKAELAERRHTARSWRERIKNLRLRHSDNLLATKGAAGPGQTGHL